MNATLWTPTLSLFAIAFACICAAVATVAHAGEIDLADSADGRLPPRLHDTGLYASGARNELRPGVVPFTPQYPLWSDGAGKRRWMALPPGTAIDASKPDAWSFPRGTRLWKEFSHAGRPVETRYIERGRDGAWRFGTYVWNESGTEAVLAPQRGTVLAIAQAPQGRYAIPSRADCIACHGSNTVPVIGASALQLSAGLRDLVAQGLVRGLPRTLPQQPQIAASSPVERAALGYLHGNCAHCHNTGPNRAPLPLTLAQRAADPTASRSEVLRSLAGAASRYRPADAESLATLVEPGAPDSSVVVHRMASRDPRVQMPPLGTSVPDTEAVSLIRRWIATDLSQPLKEPQP